MSTNKPNRFREICDFEHSLEIGSRVKVLWTAGSFGHYEGIGKVTKINTASVRVALEAPVTNRSRIETLGGYPAGQEIVVPLFSHFTTNTKWSQFNRVAPLDVEEEGKTIFNGLTVGTKIYYTGDRANVEGAGVIKKVHGNAYYPVLYDIKLEDGREFPAIQPLSFEPGPGTRFFLLSEWEAKRQKQIDAFVQKYGKKEDPAPRINRIFLAIDESEA